MRVAAQPKLNISEAVGGNGLGALFTQCHCVCGRVIAPEETQAVCSPEARTAIVSARPSDCFGQARSFSRRAFFFGRLFAQQANAGERRGVT